MKNVFDPKARLYLNHMHSEANAIFYDHASNAFSEE